MDNKIEVYKPKDWPRNIKELRLDQIQKSIHEFIDYPCAETRENMLSFVSNYDINQESLLGFWRITEYEVSLINDIYLKGKIINCNAIIVFLYELINHIIHSQKFINMINDQVIDAHVKLYEYGLCQPLKFYSYIYAIYLTKNNMSLGDQIIYIMNKNINHINKNEQFNDLLHAFQPMINDISYARSKHIEEEWCFSRDQIKEIFKIQIKLMNKLDIDPFKSPYRGVLMTAISNYLLKSRNNYNSDYIVKYMNSDVLDKTISNKQIWINKIQNLNDPREGKVLPEIFKEHDWINYSWAQNIDFKLTRKYYLTCFSKQSLDQNMKNKYGNTILGYKNDRIADDICPITHTFFKNMPFLGQVICFDVLYDRKQIKSELKILFDIINYFKISNTEKHNFLQEILQYWIFSIKDEKWKNERERRYLIFLYNDYEYKELSETDNLLKVKTFLFSTPDYVRNYTGVKTKKLFDNINHYYIAHSYVDFWFCCDCFSRDYDSINNDVKRCPICNSKNMELIKLKMPF